MDVGAFGLESAVLLVPKLLLNVATAEQDLVGTDVVRLAAVQKQDRVGSGGSTLLT